MLKKLLEPNALWAPGLTLVRIIVGGIIISFSFEMFDPENMKGYTEWLDKVNMPAPSLMAYVGKVAELVGGVLLVLGLFTRLASIPLIITMFVINFIMSNGDLRNTSFLLLLLFAVFLFAGGGKYSLDEVIRKRKKNHDDKT